MRAFAFEAIVLAAFVLFLALILALADPAAATTVDPATMGCKIRTGIGVAAIVIACLLVGASIGAIAIGVARAGGGR